MLIFIDTEFSDFINTELISIGLVSQDDKKFYAELPIERRDCSDFVRTEVLRDHHDQPQLLGMV